MQQLFGQLGIDWRLLLSQAVNFFLLFLVLRIFVYKPLLQLLRDRRARIEEGLAKADEADRRLLEVDEIGKKKVKQAEIEAVGILKRTEDEARALEASMLAEAKRKEAEEIAAIAGTLRAKELESRKKMESEAVAFVRGAIAKTVELSPQQIDDALITRAVREMKQGA